MENRDGERIIKSRIGIQRECKFVEEVIFPNDKNRTNISLQGVDCLIVDEVQFCKPEEIKEMWRVVQDLKIPVMCYGLLTDFQGDIFPASKELMVLADKREELKTVCWCGDGARCNARIDEKGNVVRKGEKIALGGNDKYISLCQKHFDEGDIGPKMRARYAAKEQEREDESLDYDE